MGRDIQSNQIINIDCQLNQSMMQKSREKKQILLVDHRVRAQPDQHRVAPRIAYENDRSFPHQGTLSPQSMVRQSKLSYSPNQLIFQSKEQVFDLQFMLNKLYTAVEQDPIRLYGITLKEGKSEHIQNNSMSSSLFNALKWGYRSLFNNQDNKQHHKQPNLQQFPNNAYKEQQPIHKQTKSRVKELDSWKKVYLWTFHFLFVREPLPPNKIIERLIEIVQSAQTDDIDNIRVIDSQIKFDKTDRSLVYKRKHDGTISWTIEPKTQKMGSLSANQFIRSETTIKVQGESTYRYDSQILQVQPYSQYLAVRTSDYVYLCREGQTKSYKMKARHMRWGTEGLYIMQSGGQIIILERNRYPVQRRSLPSLFQFQLERGHLGKWSQNDILIPIQTEMVHASFCQKNYLYLRLIGGNSTKVKLDIDQDEFRILYANGYSQDRWIIIFVLLGQSTIQIMYEYRFMYV